MDLVVDFTRIDNVIHQNRVCAKTHNYRMQRTLCAADAEIRSTDSEDFDWK